MTRGDPWVILHLDPPARPFEQPERSLRPDPSLLTDCGACLLPARPAALAAAFGKAATAVARERGVDPSLLKADVQPALELPTEAELAAKLHETVSLTQRSAEWPGVVGDMFHPPWRVHRCLPTRQHTSRARGGVARGDGTTRTTHLGVVTCLLPDSWRISNRCVSKACKVARRHLRRQVT